MRRSLAEMLLGKPGEPGASPHGGDAQGMFGGSSTSDMGDDAASPGIFATGGGPPVKRAKTDAEALRVAMGASGAAFGLSEGQTVVRIPAITDRSEAVPRGDGRFYTIDERQRGVPGRQSHQVPWLDEVAERLTLVSQHPDHSFLALHAYHTGRAIKELYSPHGQSEIARIVAERRRAMQLDQQRRIVNVDAKKRESEVLSGELGKQRVRVAEFRAQIMGVNPEQRALSAFFDMEGRAAESTLANVARFLEAYDAVALFARVAAAIEADATASISLGDANAVKARLGLAPSRVPESAVAYMGYAQRYLVDFVLRFADARQTPLRELAQAQLRAAAQHVLLGKAEADLTPALSALGAIMGQVGDAPMGAPLRAPQLTVLRDALLDGVPPDAKQGTYDGDILEAWDVVSAVKLERADPRPVPTNIEVRGRPVDKVLLVSLLDEDNETLAPRARTATDETLKRLGKSSLTPAEEQSITAIFTRIALRLLNGKSESADAYGWLRPGVVEAVLRLATVALSPYLTACHDYLARRRAVSFDLAPLAGGTVSGQAMLVAKGRDQPPRWQSAVFLLGAMLRDVPTHVATVRQKLLERASASGYSGTKEAPLVEHALALLFHYHARLQYRDDAVELAQLETQVGEMESALDALRSIIASVSAERPTVHPLEGTPGADYEEDPAWSQQAAINGIEIIKDEVVEALKDALMTLCQYFPKFRGLPLDVITRDQRSGLRELFSRFAALQLLHVETAFSSQLNRAEVPALYKRRLAELSGLLCHYTYRHVGGDRYTIFRDGVAQNTLAARTPMGVAEPPRESPYEQTYLY
jgi:hypothetical protein